MEFTAYTLFSAAISGSSCESYSTTSSLATPFFVPAPTRSVVGFYHDNIAATPFVYNINPACAVSPGYDAGTSTNFNALVATLHLSRSTVPNTHSSTSFSVPAASALSIARAVSSSALSPQNASAATATPSSTSSSLSSSTSSTETKKLIIGLVVAIVVPVILIALSLVYYIRRRRQRKKRAPTPSQDVGKREGEDAQLYFQQKVELDDEQRRHEMEAVEIRYEMEGEDEIREMPVEGRQGQVEGVRQELRGAEHARELDNSQ